MTQVEEAFGRKFERLCAQDVALANTVKEVVAELDSWKSRPLDNKIALIAGAFGEWRACNGAFLAWLAGLRLRHGSNRGIVAVFVCEHAGDHDVLERDVTAVFKQCAEGGGAKHQRSEMEADQALA